MALRNFFSTQSEEGIRLEDLPVAGFHVGSKLGKAHFYHQLLEFSLGHGVEGKIPGVGKDGVEIKPSGFGEMDSAALMVDRQHPLIDNLIEPSPKSGNGSVILKSRNIGSHLNHCCLDDLFRFYLCQSRFPGVS